MIDDDKNFDKFMDKIVIGAAIVGGTLIFAVGYDAGHQSAKKETQPTTIIYGNVINNHSNNSNSNQPTSLEE
ncbi:hypothetical protein [Microcoleus sp. bin38.metabat.b11b12b14.051]|uniref:hypothetical protein n=1 Tax=Microcoleus sp. bin38.metabat.b11b12b14.051 TaxID=2742709 RepID=UPI0025F6CEF2|nr:hypothetical protein [Microcoleus sp. bin38.metabat.b11b12b14.051]